MIARELSGWRAEERIELKQKICEYALIYEGLGYKTPEDLSSGLSEGQGIELMMQPRPLLRNRWTFVELSLDEITNYIGYLPKITISQLADCYSPSNFFTNAWVQIYEEK